MADAEIQQECERGQRELMATDYLAAIDTLAAAEQAAWDLRAYDTLSRLYLPLQEARRQARQRCGEGAVCMHIVSRDVKQPVDARAVLTNEKQGQLLIADRGSTAAAIECRTLAHQAKLYLETFLAASYVLTDGSLAVVIVPTAESVPPQLTDVPSSVKQLVDAAPPGSLVIPFDQLPADVDRGTSQSYAQVMALWEQLHLPFLTAGDRESDPARKMEAYRLTLRVDPACELAHQRLAETARLLARRDTRPTY